MSGVSRQQYATEARIIRVMCTGRIDLSFVIRALAKGADGVLIGGCWPGECHYVTEGNYDALGNMHICRKLLERIGIRPERLRIEWVAASEGARFAEIMTDFSKQVQALGPVGKAEGMDEDIFGLKLQAVNQLLPYLKLVEREKLRAPSRTEEAINAFFDGAEANRLFDSLIADKLGTSQILLLLRQGPLSSEKISERLGMSSSAVVKLLKGSLSQGLTVYDVGQRSYALARAEDQAWT